VAFRIAGLFWSRKGLNELADRASADAFREITRRINGGFNGLAERQKFYAVACHVLGVVEPSVTRGAPRMKPVPESDAEPVFERGAGAIRIHQQRGRTRKRASAARKTKPRRAATETRQPKAGVRRKARKSAAPNRKRARPKSARRKR
jgi:hypothetical protein